MMIGALPAPRGGAQVDALGTLIAFTLLRQICWESWASINPGRRASLSGRMQGHRCRSVPARFATMKARLRAMVFFGR